jgi:hypothetical protein
MDSGRIMKELRELQEGVKNVSKPLDYTMETARRATIRF